MSREMAMLFAHLWYNVKNLWAKEDTLAQRLLSTGVMS